MTKKLKKNYARQNIKRSGSYIQETTVSQTISGTHKTFRNYFHVAKRGKNTRSTLQIKDNG